MATDASDIARLVTMPHLLRHLGWRIRCRNRADCGLCRGSSVGTLAFNTRLWKCHRCNSGGDVFSLVQAANGCQFPAALRYVAQVAGISFNDSEGAELRHELSKRKRQLERIENAARALEETERMIRVQCCKDIHQCESTKLKVSERLAALEHGGSEHFPGEREGLWATLQAAHYLTESVLLTYMLLSFAEPAERTRYVLADWRTRAEIAASVRRAGGVRAESGHWMEVPA